MTKRFNNITVDYAITLYIDGKFSNNGKITELGNKISRNNLDILGEVKELKSYIENIYILSEITLQLIYKNEKYVGEANSIKRLSYSQKEYLSLLNDLIVALKKYSINSVVLNSLKQFITTTKANIDRSLNLNVELSEELGVYSIIKLVEKENNTKILEHIENFKEQNLQENNYKDLVDKYIEYIEEVTLKNKLNITDEVTKAYNQFKKDKVNKNDIDVQSDKIQKEFQKMQHLKDIAIEKHNEFLNLFSKMANENSLWNRSEYKALLERMKVLDFNFYYIILVNNKSDVKYFDSCGSINSRGYMNIFSTRQDAEHFLSNVNEGIKRSYKHIEIMYVNYCGGINKEINNISNNSDSALKLRIDSILSDIKEVIGNKGLSELNSRDARVKDKRRLFNSLVDFYIDKNGLNVSYNMTDKVAYIIKIITEDNILLFVDINLNLTNDYYTCKLFKKKEIDSIQLQQLVGALISKNGIKTKSITTNAIQLNSWYTLASNNTSSKIAEFNSKIKPDLINHLIQGTNNGGYILIISIYDTLSSFMSAKCKDSKAYYYTKENSKLLKYTFDSTVTILKSAQEVKDTVSSLRDKYKYCIIRAVEISV